MTVKVGILGAGYMGKTHGRILRGDPRVILSAVFDIDAQRKEEAARELECRAAESEEQLTDQVDAVYVTLPNTTHAAASARALERGIDVVVATPGRAHDHIRRGTLELGGVAAVVLDEADEMLDMGFADDLEAILAETPRDIGGLPPHTCS